MTAWAAVTKCQWPGALNHRHGRLPALEAGSPRSGSARSVSPEGSLLGVQTAAFFSCSHVLFPPSTCVLPGQTPVLLDQDPTLMTSVSCNHLFKGCSYTQLHWKLRFSDTNLFLARKNASSRW